MIVHLDGAPIREPVVPAGAEMLRGCFRGVQWIVNGWDYAWRCACVLWEQPANRDDFDGLRAALTAASPS